MCIRDSPMDLPEHCSFYDRCHKRCEECCGVDPDLMEIEEGHFVKCCLYVRHGSGKDTENE